MDEKIKNLLIQFFHEAGYYAIAEAIKNNDKPKENALFGLKMFASRIPQNKKIEFEPKIKQLETLIKMC